MAFQKFAANRDDFKEVAPREEVEFLEWWEAGFELFKESFCGSMENEGRLGFLTEILYFVSLNASQRKSGTTFVRYQH